MGFHHVALATKDLEATHRFYTEVMGFELVKVVGTPTPDHTGWARHVFYDTHGSGLLAFWDIHDEAIGTDFDTDLSASLGLPQWVNHVAFDAPAIEDLDAHRRCWQEHGITVAEIDHGWCTSIYTTDPNGILVEFCCTTRAFTAEDVAQAQRDVLAARLELESDPPVRIHRAISADATV